MCTASGTRTLIYFLPGKLQSGDTDLERFLVYLCIGVKLLILDTLSTYTYEIDLKNLHLNTPFLLVLNNNMRGGVNNFMPFRTTTSFNYTAYLGALKVQQLIAKYLCSDEYEPQFGRWR